VEKLPDDAYTGEYFELGFDRDFEDNAEVRRRLPKLAALYAC
jgi:hypothetical protein